MKKSASGFNRIAKEVFAPVYPVIARAAVAWSGITEGWALDVGTGSGLLAIALACETRMRVCALDMDPEMIRIAGQNLADAGGGPGSRICLVNADVHRMPLKEKSISLVVSRGSLLFWDDLTLAFDEIYRVLRSGGAAFVGGGFGNAHLREDIFDRMRMINPDWDADVARRSSMATPETLRKALEKSGVPDFLVRDDDTGTWVELRKS